MEFIVAEVKGGINRFEGFKVNIEFSLFSFIGDNIAIGQYTGKRGRAKYPQNTTSPFGGTLLYNFNLCWVDVIAPRTESRFTRDLIFEAVPYSSASIFCTRET